MSTVSAGSAPADYTGLSIVLIGPCDPMLMQPYHLAERELISETEAAELRYDILAPEISVLRLPWIRVIVEPGKITAATTSEAPLGEPVRDFVLSFCASMPLAPFKALGINHEQHFGVSDTETWHRIGHTLAPKESIWDSVMDDAGMAELSIRGKRRDSTHPGVLNVKIEPSTRISPGVYVRVNDHYTADDDTVAKNPGYLLETLEQMWIDSAKANAEIVSKLKSLVDVAS